MSEMPDKKKQLILGVDLATGEDFSLVSMPYELYEKMKLRADIADQLAEALSRVSSFLRDEGIRQCESYYDGKLRKQAEIGYAAIEAYRKAKGE